MKKIIRLLVCMLSLAASLHAETKWWDYPNCDNESDHPDSSGGAGDAYSSSTWCCPYGKYSGMGNYNYASNHCSGQPWSCTSSLFVIECETDTIHPSKEFKQLLTTLHTDLAIVMDPYVNAETTAEKQAIDTAFNQLMNNPTTFLDSLQKSKTSTNQYNATLVTTVGIALQSLPYLENFIAESAKKVHMFTEDENNAYTHYQNQLTKLQNALCIIKKANLPNLDGFAHLQCTN